MEGVNGRGVGRRDSGPTRVSGKHMAAHSSNMPASADTAGSVPKHGEMHSID